MTDINSVTAPILERFDDEAEALEFAQCETEESWVIYSTNATDPGYFVDFSPPVARSGERVIAHFKGGVAQ